MKSGFPCQEIGGMVDASEEGVLNVEKWGRAENWTQRPSKYRFRNQGRSQWRNRSS